MNDLITKNTSLVRHLANTISSPSHHDDLVGEGMLALVKLADRFDPSRGTTFGVFARKRIKGAMLNYLQKMTKVSGNTVSVENKDSNGDRYIDTIGGDGQADRATLRDVLSYHLNPVEEWVIMEKYFHKARLENIAKELGFKISRVSQIHSNAIQKLKKVFAPPEEPQEESDDNQDALLQVVRKMIWDEWGVEVYEL